MAPTSPIVSKGVLVHSHILNRTNQQAHLQQPHPRLFNLPLLPKVCLSNKVDLICNVSLLDHIARSQDLQRGRPIVKACPLTVGTILQTILETLDGHPSTSLTLGIADMLIFSTCHMTTFGYDTTGAWSRIIIPAFTGRIKWVERKTVQKGAIVNTDGRRMKAFTFDETEEVEKGRFNVMSIDGAHTPKGNNIGSLMWATPSPAQMAPSEKRMSPPRTPRCKRCT